MSLRVGRGRNEVKRLAAALGLATLSAAPAATQGPTPYDLPVPIPSSHTVRMAAPVTDPEKQRTLVEMWARGILDKGMREWEIEDMDLLKRMQGAERLRAFDLLLNKAGTLRGYAVAKPDSGHQELWLTKAGYTQYFFLKSQQARKYFEQKGTDAKWSFGVRTEAGKKIFDVSGTLTKEGDALYTQILQGRPSEWRTPDGQTRSNVRPKRAAPTPTPSPVKHFGP